MIGTRLGHYEVVSAIGRGGMGEVWRARDTTLGREVAIKTLPEEFARDADRLARFEREAKLLASLNHPNIAAIYGLDEHDRTRFLVLELVEGPTLADRIAQGAIPVEESLKLALQIAEALEAAHGKGVIHRDLKPANIKLTEDGQVKVLDFGLAKAYAGPGDGASASQSPTLSMAATQQGLILGTAAYMSPEQARGQEVDQRTDTWAFGCVLYEMLTGHAAFPGDDVTDILASVLKSEPDYEKLPPLTPVRLRSNLLRCLQKDPRRRWHDVADVRLELDSVIHPSPDEHPTTVPTPARIRSFRWAIAAVAGWAVLALGAGTLFSPDPMQTGGLTGVVRFPLMPPEGVSMFPGWVHPKLLLSPDGQRLGFAGVGEDGITRLWFRSLEAETLRPLAGTEGIESAFWSPDGQWLGIANADSVRRVDVATGEVRTIADRRSIPQRRNIAWASDDVIVFGGEGTGLHRMSASGGGDPEVLYEFEDSATPGWLAVLRDRRHFLFSILGSGVYVGSVDGDPQRLLLEQNFDQRSALFYAPPYLLYVEEGVLWAHPFDEESLSLSGDPVAVLEGIPKSGAGFVPVAVSPDVLAYWPRQTGYRSVLTWVDRDGAVLGRVGPPAIYTGLALSPEGGQIAFGRFDEIGDRDIWVRDSRGNEIRKTFDGDSTGPLFASDGGRLLFSSARGAPPNLHVLPVTGTGDQRITQSGLVQTVRSWSQNQDLVVYEQRDPARGFDLWVHHFADGADERLSWNTSFNESYGRLSPDERWIAYVYDGSGQKEVWVANFPSGEIRRAVAPGTAPEWKGDGEELFYIPCSQTRRIGSVRIA